MCSSRTTIQEDVSEMKETLLQTEREVYNRFCRCLTLEIIVNNREHADKLES